MQNYPLKCEILRALSQCRGYLLPEPTLHHQLRLLLRPAPAEADFHAALRELDAAHLIIGARDALGGPVKWRLTDAGRAEFDQQLL